MSRTWDGARFGHLKISQIWSNNWGRPSRMYHWRALGTSITLYQWVYKHVSLPEGVSSTTDLNIEAVIMSHGWVLWL
ncbi:hypothetical protein TNCV_3183221 [Trichonephila clavipes]|uniref:Uncharacterized protein n=1 Tax=Trichonephila clavipes TaxID=2585209 RepID=A0A8X6VL79_TRICX|nr:hypothetical protein TNCV_3183221 [Trichonephila clavipes]